VGRKSHDPYPQEAMEAGVMPFVTHFTFFWRNKIEKLRVVANDGSAAR